LKAYLAIVKIDPSKENLVQLAHRYEKRGMFQNAANTLREYIKETLKI
jgi:hypothetical protein